MTVSSRPVTTHRGEAGATDPVVRVDELQRAWHALRAGEFRAQTGTSTSSHHASHHASDHASDHATDHATGDLHADQHATSTTPQKSWTPPPGSAVLPVLGCGSGAGATTFAVALATAAGSGRVIECASVTETGLASAATAQLGRTATSDWIRGRRGPVTLDRTARLVLGPGEVPAPAALDTGSSRHRTLVGAASDAPVDAQHEFPGGHLDVLDVSWPLAHVLATPCWLADRLATDSMVLLGNASTASLRRLESALGLLTAQAHRVDVLERVVLVVRGPFGRSPAGYRARAAHLQPHLGPLTRAAHDVGHLFTLRDDRRLAQGGLDAPPLPTQLLSTAGQVLGLVDRRSTNTPKELER